jgi:hypothetical protein
LAACHISDGERLRGRSRNKALQRDVGADQQRRMPRILDDQDAAGRDFRGEFREARMDGLDLIDIEVGDCDFVDRQIVGDDVIPQDKRSRVDFVESLADERDAVGLVRRDNSRPRHRHRARLA